MDLILFIRLRGPELKFELGAGALPSKPDDWVRLQLRVERQGWLWQREDACLQRWELDRLIDWFDAVVKCSDQDHHLDSVDGVLQWSYDHKRTRLIIELRYEFRPPGTYEDVSTPFVIELPAESNELIKTIARLRANVLEAS